jgi:hypothetical protein
MNRLMAQARFVAPTWYTPRVAARLRRKQERARQGAVEHAWGPRIDEAFRIFASEMQVAVQFRDRPPSAIPLADRLPPRSSGVRYNAPILGSLSNGEDAG